MTVVPVLKLLRGSGATLLLAVLVAVAAGAGSATAAPATSGPSAPHVEAGPTFENITATPTFSFVPNTFTVAPGATVHLVVTQAADFNHTFTLSSAVNVTIPSSDTPSELAAFFNAHPPLVNLSLGSTAGSQHDATFTAPRGAGTYEFVCLIHFPTMIGVMTDSNSTPAGSSPSGLTTLELVGIGAVIAVVLIAGVVVLARRRRPPR
jgi:plastocyanin